MAKRKIRSKEYKKRRNRRQTIKRTCDPDYKRRRNLRLKLKRKQRRERVLNHLIKHPKKNASKA